MSRVILLSSAVQAHGDTIEQLTLRPPTGKDLRLCGVPYRITAEGEIIVDGSGMSRMISALGGVPPSTIDQLAAGDWQTAMMEVLGFISEKPGKPTSNS